MSQQGALVGNEAFKCETIVNIKPYVIYFCKKIQCILHYLVSIYKAPVLTWVQKQSKAPDLPPLK